MAHAMTPLRAGWGRFRGWRHTRPFWGGLLLVAAGIELLVAPAAQSLILPIDLIIYAGIAGVSGTLIGVLVIAIGVLSWFQPEQHSFFGLVGLMLALVSFVTSNFGGFVIGMLLGIVGGALVFAWGPAARVTPTEDVLGEPGEPDEPVEPAAGAGNGPLASVALPLALALTLAAAPAPAADWPWDWFGSEDGDEEQPSDETPPSADPTPGPTSEPTDRPGPGAGEPDEPDGSEGADGPEEDEEEADAEEDVEGDPEDCALLTGDSGLADSEEEFVAAVRACQAARDEDGLPEVGVEGDQGCFRGSVRTSGLTADQLTMSGARFAGVVECPTADGSRRYLRLTMSQADLRGAELWFEDAGTRMSLGLPAMAMTGDVEMHITRMHVRILGIPLTFTPDFPPPLLLPYMIVTDVDVDDPMAGTDTMTIPDLNGQYGGS